MFELDIKIGNCQYSGGICACGNKGGCPGKENTEKRKPSSEPQRTLIFRSEIKEI